MVGPKAQAQGDADNVRLEKPPSFQLSLESNGIKGMGMSWLWETVLFAVERKKKM